MACVSCAASEVREILKGSFLKIINYCMNFKHNNQDEQLLNNFRIT